MHKFAFGLVVGLACAACVGKVSEAGPLPSSDAPPAASVGAPAPIAMLAPQPAAAVDSSYAPLLPGEEAGSTHAILRRSAAVVVGTVQAISYTYDEHLGPRTVSTIAIDEVYLGDDPGGTVELAMFGGPAPDGRYYSSSASSEFVVGQRYVLFLTNSRWTDTPLEAPPLRIGTVSGREILTDESNHTLNRLVPEGLRFGPAPTQTVLAGTGVFDRADLRRLLSEATVDEGVSPSGAFSRVPTMHSDNWRVSPGSPPAPANPGTAANPGNAANQGDAATLGHAGTGVVK